jgi:hypothetical protein
MIISHRLKFAFFCNQRTGSKAAGIALRFTGAFDKNDILIAQPFPATRTARIEIPAYNLGDYASNVVTHFTPQKAIDAGFITLEQLREYDCYAFLRRPVDRFMAIRASMQVNRNGMFAKPGKRIAGACTPQHEFFFVDDEQVVTTLDFDNYGDELKMLVEKLGSYPHMDIPVVVKEPKPYMPRKVEYDAKIHHREEELYRKMKREN